MIGRDTERQRARAVAASVAAGQRAAAVVVAGEPGSGRTTFLDAIAEDAAAEGCAVVRVTGIEAESELSWSGLHALCQPIRSSLAGLPTHHRRVLEGALALGPPVDADGFGVAVATLQLLGAASDERPLALLIDDFGWLDPPSREVIRFVARRLDGEAVLLVLSVHDVAADLAALEMVSLGRLQEHDVATLLAARSGVPVVADVARELAVATSGNARAVVELAGSLSREQLLGSAPLPQPLPIRSAVESAFAGQLEWLSGDTCAALRVLALSASGGRDELETALKDLGLDLTAFEPAIESDLVAATPSGYAFRHPLARAAVNSAASTLERRRAHRALASAIDPDRELERHARHLAAGVLGPDADAAAVVELAADSAFRRGAEGSASALFEEAARLAPARAGELLVRAGDAALAAGAPHRAAGLLDHAMTLLPADDRSLRARCTQLRAHAAHETGERSIIGQLRSEADAIAADDLHLAVSLLADAALVAAVGGWVDEALTVSDHCAALAEGLTGRPALLATVARGAALVIAGDVDDARPLLATWEELLDIADEPDVRRTLQSLAIVLLWAEELEQAARLLDHLEAIARRHRSIGLLTPVLLSSGIVAFSTGDWTRMEESIREAAALAAAAGHRRLELLALANLALFEVNLGRPTASERVDAVVRMTDGSPPRSIALLLAAARAGEAMLHGRPANAVSILRRFGDAEPRGNPAPLLWEADLADAELAAGDRAAAARTLAGFAPRAEAAGNRRCLARAAAIAAVLTEDLEAGRRAIADAIAGLEELSLPFVRARVQLQWATHLLDRGAGAEAAAVLDAALQTFDALGAEPWSRRCRELLGRPEPTTTGVALDAEERRIVEALARGESVGDIALATFRSAATVERQLASALDKLGLSSRDELPAVRPDVVATHTSVRLLGDFAVQRGGIDLTPPAGMPAKALKIIALADGLLHVEELAEVLWRDAEAGRGRARLRNVLGRLRAVSGEIVERRGDLLAVADGVRVDVTAFRSLASQAFAAGPTPAGEALAARALELYGGDLLPDSVYEPWTTVTRERLRLDRLGLLDLRAEVAEDNDPRAAVRLLEDAIVLEPYDEHRYVRLARLHRALGRPGTAGAVERRARAALADLGLEPGPELRGTVGRSD